MITKRVVEEWAPLCIAVVVSAVWFSRAGSIPYFFAKELLSAILSAAAVGAGFLTTALSILMSIGATPIGHQLRRRKKMDLLYSYLRCAVFSCLVVVLACVVVFFYLEENVGIGTSPSTMVIFASVLCLGYMLRIVEILIRVFVSMAENGDDSE